MKLSQAESGPAAVGLMDTNAGSDPAVEHSIRTDTNSALVSYGFVSAIPPSACRKAATSGALNRVIMPPIMTDGQRSGGLREGPVIRFRTISLPTQFYEGPLL